MSLKRLRTWEKKMPLVVVLCFMRGTEGLRSGISALQLNQSAVFGKPASSFDTSADYRGGILTHYTRSRVHAEVSLDHRLWIGIFAQHHFRGLSPDKLQLIAHKSAHGSVIDCTCPPPAL